MPLITQQEAAQEPFVEFDAGPMASSHSQFNVAFLVPALAVLGNATNSILTVEDVNMFRMPDGRFRVQRRLDTILKAKEAKAPIHLWQGGTLATHDPEPGCSTAGPHPTSECALLRGLGFPPVDGTVYRKPEPTS